MIRCGAFCLTLEEGAGEKASRAAGGIDRHGVEVRSHAGIDLLDGRRGNLVALEFGERGGLPVVHGSLGDEACLGEFSMMEETERSIVASRDWFGTRPLFRALSGEWVASDHRFFPGEQRELIPPGARLEVASGEVLTASWAQEHELVPTFDEAAQKLAAMTDASVRSRVEGKRRVAVAFSGGLDSSILACCASKHTKTVACCVSARGSTDSRVAEEAARAIGLEFATAEMSREDVSKELGALDLPFQPSPMDRGLWCLYSMTAQLASESGAELILLGQLADELFGGYAKYEAALRTGGGAEASKMMSEDVMGCGERGFIRDELACSRWCEPRFPFAEGRLARFGQLLPVKYKLRNGARKAVLREAALRLGLPEEIAYRPKKAAQYSSGVLKLLG
ncbi:MAG: asparagine synthase-related protein [Nitrososphaerales archaeon]|nr:asparagine synthase-related protein [Nitrososphaerales archaeon]